MQEEKPIRRNEHLQTRQDLKAGVINALRAGATKDNANKVRPYMISVLAINIEIDEQWETLFEFSEKAVKFKNSGDVEDLK
mgnify:CR=1 FL=1